MDGFPNPLTLSHQSIRKRAEGVRKGKAEYGR